MVVNIFCKITPFQKCVFFLLLCFSSRMSLASSRQSLTGSRQSLSGSRHSLSGSRSHLASPSIEKSNEGNEQISQIPKRASFVEVKTVII